MLSRIPDQSLVEDPGAGPERIMAARGDGYAFVYLPTGREVTVHLETLRGPEVTASWFDPRNGQTMTIDTYNATGVREFVPPSRGRGRDWVLILDSD